MLCYAGRKVNVIARARSPWPFVGVTCMCPEMSALLLPLRNLFPETLGPIAPVAARGGWMHFIARTRNERQARGGESSIFLAHWVFRTCVHERTSEEEERVCQSPPQRDGAERATEAPT